MKNTVTDTIAALCAGAGGALSILRISGPDALEIASKIWKGSSSLSAPPRMMRLGKTSSSDADSPGEPCLAVFMPGPNSYTGEDITEIQCHGGNLAPMRILNAALHAGARHAEPGEFTKRAFINGKMDLTQAEAVADLISARSEKAYLLAERQLSGRLGSQLKGYRLPLIHVLAEVESRMDFPEEELDWEKPEELMKTILRSLDGIRKLLSTERYGAIVREGLQIVLAGRPNVGKSSLLNHLLGFDRAIVTEIAGTTRDTLEENANIRGITVKLTDTAGIRDSSGDPIEGLGIKRSKDSIHTAEIVVWMLDASNPAHYADEIAWMNAELPKGIPVIACWNKIDRMPPDTSLPELDMPTVKISVLNSSGIEELADQLELLMWGAAEHQESETAISARHAGLLSSAAESLEKALDEIAHRNWELAASCLHSAVTELGTVSGENATPDILDEIFSRFCIGK